MTAVDVRPWVYHEPMREPEGYVVVEDEGGDLWLSNSDRKWVCQTDQGWTNTWKEFLSRHEPVTIYVDREWFYGREPQQSHASGEVFHHAKEDDDDIPWAVTAEPGHGVSVTPTDRRDLTPDEAVELARAILAAAEVAKQS